MRRSIADSLGASEYRYWLAVSESGRSCAPTLPVGRGQTPPHLAAGCLVLASRTPEPSAGKPKMRGNLACSNDVTS